VRCLTRLAGAGPARDLSDADLLERFRAGHEEAAFALLVQRHGPAVLGVCRRLLGNAADADDAFQATFLVLLRRADSIRKRSSLGSWLHGVAFHVAIRARTRRRPGTALPEVPAAGGEPGDAAARREACALMDEEIGRLPERYRAPLVLCGLEGKTCEQAARELGWPKSSLAHRLGRAKELLRGRLVRRGVAVPAVLLAAALVGEAGAAAVPALLALATVRLAAHALAGGAPASSPAVALAEGVARGVAPGARAAALALVAATAGLLVLAAGLVAGPRGAAESPAAGPPPAKADAPAAEPRKDREGFPLPAEAVARVGSARLRHGRWLQNLTYSPDGRILASAGGGTLRLWDAGTGRLLRDISVGEGGIAGGLFSADGKTVVVLDGETCRWFDAGTGKEVRHCEVKVPKTESYANFAPHGEALAVVGTAAGQDLVVYDLPSGKERFRKTAGGAWFWEPVFSPDGKVLAALELPGKGRKANRVALFDTAGGQLLGEFDPSEMFRPQGFSPDGKKLLGVNNSAKALLIWSVPRGEALHRAAVPVNSVVTAAFAPDGQGILVGSQDLDAVLLDPATGKELRRFRTYPSSIRLAFAPDGKAVAIAVGDGIISQWDLATGRPLAASAEPIIGYGRPEFDADGKLLWAVTDTPVALDWRAGREVRRLRVPNEGNSWVMAPSPDRSRVAGVNADRKLAVWDAATGKELCVLSAVSPGWVSRTFSRDGKTLYTGEWGRPVRAWDANTGQERPALDKEERKTHSLVVSPDGRWLAAADHPQAAGGTRAEVTVWDLRAGREAHRLLPGPGSLRAWALAFSPDGTLLAAAGGQYPVREYRDAFVTVWDLRTGKERMSRTGLTSLMHSVAFSADGRMLVTGSADGAVRLWEVAAGQERHRFAGHETNVYSVAFSPDSRLVAAASADAPVYVWDVTGCHDRPPSATAFTAEEKDRLWKSLADADAAAAFRATRQLLARPGPAAALLADRLKPAATVEAKVIEQHVRALDADDFAVREKAAAELAKVVEQAEPLLRKALENSPSAEAKRQIEALLGALEAPSPERLRQLRAVEVLERAGTAETRKLLDELAGGAKDARLTREAKAALGRIKES
jgi:RNA polymerase sigma factor (sigma-70 family)